MFSGNPALPSPECSRKTLQVLGYVTAMKGIEVCSARARIA
jgi:hypothetical protein